MEGHLIMEKPTNSSFIMFMKDNTDFEYLVEQRPTAFALLAIIAKRARRTLDHPDPNLQIGEAYIGDYKKYGVTEQIYRTDKDYLQRFGFATFRATNKGTIARLIKQTIFNINIEKQRTEPQASNGQATTNNKDNKYSRPFINGYRKQWPPKSDGVFDSYVKAAEARGEI